MPGTQLSVSLALARTLLNDDSNSLWTDAVLIPKAQQAHRELQQKLRKFSVPIMRNFQIVGNIPIGTGQIVQSGQGTPTLSPDFIEPIRLWENAAGGPVTGATLMTEVDSTSSVLNQISDPIKYIYWYWDGFQINFPRAGLSARDITVFYWRSLPVPAVNTDLISVLNGEVWLAPRIAALAAGSVGEEKVFTAMTALAEQNIADVIIANRGRSSPSYGMTLRP